MKKLIVAAIPALLALSACSQGSEGTEPPAAAKADDDNDVADPSKEQGKAAEAEHGDDHPHDGEDANHSH